MRNRLARLRAWMHDNRRAGGDELPAIGPKGMALNWTEDDVRRMADAIWEGLPAPDDLMDRFEDELPAEFTMAVTEFAIDKFGVKAYAEALQRGYLTQYGHFDPGGAGSPTDT